MLQSEKKFRQNLYANIQLMKLNVMWLTGLFSSGSGTFWHRCFNNDHLALRFGASAETDKCVQWKWLKAWIKF